MAAFGRYENVLRTLSHRSSFATVAQLVEHTHGKSSDFLPYSLETAMCTPNNG